MKHVETAKNRTSRRDVEKHLTGRFYTPVEIALKIADQSIALFSNPTSIGDPFCGDGRLIVAWIQQAAQSGSLRNLRHVILWDYDVEAVKIAKESVIEVLDAHGLSKQVSLNAGAGDSFLRVHNLAGTVDTVLTNPPWELLKPDSRDGINDKEGYTKQLRSYAAMLAKDFPGAMSAKGKAMTGYGVNLARAGAIASAMLTRKDGVIAIVLPSSIFADQASVPFRCEFFTKLRAMRIDWYPAEARLFEGVDQSFVTAAAIVGSSTSTLKLVRHSKALDVLEERQVDVSIDPSKPLAFNVAAEHESLVQNFQADHPSLHSLEVDMRFGLWMGREIDETRLTESLTDKNAGVPFLKGRHVFPYQIVREDIWYIDPHKRQIPTTIKEERLAWRDVSRPNQRRRMHVALVPRGNITGNSLGVAYLRYGPIHNIRLLMAIMNSMGFELQVRTQLSTGHVSQGVLRKCTIPMGCFEDEFLKDKILKLVESCQSLQKEQPELEVLIARAYGVNREQFAFLVDAFPKLTIEEKESYLSKELWL